MDKFKSYLNFDTMITPLIVKILFWVGVAGGAIYGIVVSFSGLGMIFGYGNGFLGFLLFLLGFVIFAVGVLLSRLYCEILIVIFKMQESLNAINQKLDKLD